MNDNDVELKRVKEENVQLEFTIIKMKIKQNPSYQLQNAKMLHALQLERNISTQKGNGAIEGKPRVCFTNREDQGQPSQPAHGSHESKGGWPGQSS